MAFDFAVPTLGPCSRKSPITLSTRMDDFIANYVSDDQRILHELVVPADTDLRFAPWEMLELAGPRECIYFDPPKVHAAIVTCGGLCPGLNDVVRAIVMTLWHDYGVRRISGIRYGYRGLYNPEVDAPIALAPDIVAGIHRTGGTMLGSSRGGSDRVPEMVDYLASQGVNMLFTIGGDGTQRGSLAIAEELTARGLEIAVVGVPKTIDNDLSFLERSFGFETAVSKAVEAVYGAHVEADNAVNGIGLVKVMGRESGFIAAHTALATSDVNFVLIPEVPFHLVGDNGLLEHLKQRILKRGHAVVLVAEGAGQGLFEDTGATDASGNRKLGDIGPLLADHIKTFFVEQEMKVSLKYIDPSYIIRSAPANPNDSIYCSRLGTNAAHAAMAGKTRMIIGLVNNCLVHIPTDAAVSKRNAVDPEGALWRDVVVATGQPPLMVNEG